MAHSRVALAALLVLSILPACRRKTSEKARVPAPAGGVAAETEDAGDAVVEDARRYPARVFRFSLDQFDLTIEDVGMSTAIDVVYERTKAEVVVNAGFFDRTGKAVGLAISGGVRLSPFTKSLSGGVLTYDGDRARLFETESFELPEKTRFAIQCRPRLVVDGVANVKSDDGKRSERTALCIEDGGKTLEAIIVRGAGVDAEQGPSLFAFGKWLARHGCEAALNLDGGPSTGAAWRDDEMDKPMLLAPRAPIRYAIVMKRR